MISGDYIIINSSLLILFAPFIPINFNKQKFKRMKGLLFLGVFTPPFYFSQTTDSVQVTSIQAVEFTKRTPVAKSIINVEKDLADKNLGQELPILLKTVYLSSGFIVGKRRASRIE